MEFLSPIFIPKSLAPTNDQNLKKGRPVFLFKLVFEIRFSDALLATEVICDCIGRQCILVFGVCSFISTGCCFNILLQYDWSCSSKYPLSGLQLTTVDHLGSSMVCGMPFKHSYAFCDKQITLSVGAVRWHNSWDGGSSLVIVLQTLIFQLSSEIL